MTVQILLGLIIAFFTLAFVGAFAIGIYFLGKHSAKDNPQKGVVFIKTGNHISGIKAKLIRKTSKGSSYLYGKNSAVIVPKKYHDIYFKNMRMIFVKHINQLISSPFDDDEPLIDSEKADLIYDVVSSQIGYDAVKAVKGKSQFNIILVAIIAFIIGVVVVIGFNSFQDTMRQKQVTQPTQSSINTEMPIEVK